MVDVKLLHSTPIEIVIRAIRTCYDSHARSDSSYYVSKDLKTYNKIEFQLGDRDKNLIERIIESKHDSTLEHCVFSFEITNMSRLCLQELSRHRMASPSVKSSRYTLKELKDEKPFDMHLYNDSVERASKYINLLGKVDIDIASIQALENVRALIQSGKYTNDEIKYCLPECYKVSEVFTINTRSLRNLFALRTAPEAHFEIKELAHKMRAVIPSVYSILF